MIKASNAGKGLTNVLLDCPGADIVLRSHDFHHFLVPKIYIVYSSPVLRELIRKTMDLPGRANADESLQVLKLPESGEILKCLLTFVFPVIPRVPSTLQETMELLSVAQNYQMKAVLSHIRASIAQQNLLPTRLEPALHLYALAQKYKLRPEALQAAQSILKYPMTIESFYNKLDIMPGAFLYELWEYLKRVRAILTSDLTKFRASRACGTIIGIYCTEISSSRIPRWLDQYIESIGKAPNLFDTAELSMALACHTKKKVNEQNCECASIPSQTMRDFWEALASVVHGSFKKVGG
jgi:BTB/POZ domain